MVWNDSITPKEGQVRIVVPHMDKGHEHLGLGMMGLTVVQIVDPKAYEIGWRVGDEVVKVNRVPVNNELEFREAITRAISRNRLTASPLLFDVWREPARSVHHRPPMAPMMSGHPAMLGVAAPGDPGIPRNISLGPGALSAPGASPG